MLANSPVRRLVDRLYSEAGVLAAACMVGIAGLTLASIVGKWIGNQVPWLADYASYCMAASFLALAYTFGHGGHIRVGPVLQHLQPGPRRVLEIWGHAIGFFVATYFAYYSIKWSAYRLRLTILAKALIRRHGDHHLDRGVLLESHGAAVVCLDGRDSVPNAA